MITVSIDGVVELSARLDRIASGKVRRRILNKVAKHVRKKSIQRTVKQTDLEGRQFAPHSRGRKRKMLTRLARRLAVVDLTEASATVGWRNRFESGIAAKQQLGFSQTFNKSQFKDKTPKNTKDPATRRQAKALLEAGYKVKRPNGRGTKTPSIKWITSNLNIGKAGVILRALRGSKTNWKTTLPPRSFLGVTPVELGELTELAIAEINKVME